MLKGDNELRLNHDTLKAALQSYFDTVTFPVGLAPQVESITQEKDCYGTITVFVVKVSEKQITKAAGSGTV